MEKINHLTLIKRYDKKFPTYHVQYCTVRCDCGEIKDIQYWTWRKGKVKSCGCMRLKLLSEAAPEGDPRFKHRLHVIWTGMKQRCYNEKSENYHNYGKRGISVCDEWRNDYLKFYEWAMNHGYEDTLTIDRIDVNGNYEPENCRWATYKQQGANKRPPEEWNFGETRYAMFKGKKRLKSAICKEYRVNPVTVAYRVKKMGKTFEEAVLMDKLAKGRPQKFPQE